MAMGRKPKPFSSFYAVNPATDCWEWQGAFDGQPRGGDNPRGRYGRHRRTSAHRASYVAHTGPVPDGMQVCHRCDNPACVNPAHLFLGTAQDNMDDQIRKGRNAVLNGARPRLGTSFGHVGATSKSCVWTDCCICGKRMEQPTKNFRLGHKPCCGPKCKRARLSVMMRETRARKHWSRYT